jgi:hypothetical protein
MDENRTVGISIIAANLAARCTGNVKQTPDAIPKSDPTGQQTSPVANDAA